MSDTTDDGPHVRPFADFLTAHRKGVVHTELSEGLHRLIDAVQDTQKAGALTLTLKLGIDKKTGMLQVEDNVTLKTPVHDRKSALYFVDDDGNTTRRDPTQLAFEGIRAVPESDSIRETKHA
ncbi:hypothetical protein [Nocardia wallacei]|uniref:hypothetical protein n=1 Tax=Nocardia wallacei TaxID=480035 RepID=UPI002454438E|nr:hypothetical protein [Nocardia wallacei]